MERYISQFRIDMGIEDLDDIQLLYTDYLNESYDLVNNIQALIEGSSPIHSDELERIVHNLKGVSANLYVEPVYKNSVKLDDFLKTHPDTSLSCNEVKPLWQPLLEAYTETRQQIINFFSK